MKMLRIDDRPTKLAQAVAELGRIDKTIHSLTYVDDESKRRRTLTKLNRGEDRRGPAQIGASSVGAVCFLGARGGSAWGTTPPEKPIGPDRGRRLNLKRVFCSVAPQYPTPGAFADLHPRPRTGSPADIIRAAARCRRPHRQLHCTFHRLRSPPASAFERISHQQLPELNPIQADMQQAMKETGNHVWRVHT